MCKVLLVERILFLSLRKRDLGTGINSDTTGPFKKTTRLREVYITKKRKASRLRGNMSRK